MKGGEGVLAKKLSPNVLVVLMLGILSQVAQVLLLREFLVVFHGNELSIGLVLAAWLLWVGMGSRLGAFLTDRISNYTPLFCLKVTSFVSIFLLPGSILFIRVLRGFFDILPGAYLALTDMAISVFLLMAPLCLLLGSHFVWLSKVWREFLETKDTTGAEKTYIVEAAGNMAGGVLFTFVMVHHLNSFQSALLVSGLMLVTVICLSNEQDSKQDNTQTKTARTRFNSSFVFIPLLILVILISFPLLENLDKWAYQLQWRDFALQHELISTHQSKHGTIFISQHEEQFSFFQNGHLLFSTAGPEIEAPGLEEQDAVDFAYLAMIQHEDPNDILLINGGMRGTLGEILKYPSVEKVDYIERDEILTKGAKPHVSKTTKKALNDPRVELIHGDGRLFVKTTEENYDMIIVDSPEPVTADLNRYYTKEFFQETKKLLNNDGVFVTNAKSTPDLRGTAIANRNATIYHTLNNVFSRVLPAGDQYMTFFATESPEQISVNAMELEQRFLERGIQVDEFSHHRFQQLLEESQLQRVNWTVRNHGRTARAHLEGPEATPVFPGGIEEQESDEKELPPVKEDYFINTDFKPIGYFYSLMFWENLTRDTPGFSLGQLLHVEKWWIIPLALLPIFGVMVLRKTRIKNDSYPCVNFAILFTVFSTGLSTMTLQIALIFSFQSIYGFVYETVGLITALFMGGLAFGAYIIHGYVKDKLNLMGLAKVQFIMAVLALLIALLLPFSARLESPQLIFGLFSSLTLLAGLINGIDFPLAISCYMNLNQNADKSTGIIYGMELFGACLGAILASAVLAPVLGIVFCCIMAATASFVAFLVLLLVRK